MSSIVIGTEKGAYNLTRSGSSWDVQGPLFPGWRVSAFGRAPSGAYLAAVASNWFGVGIHRSEDLAEWEAIDSPPAWPEETERKMEQIWRFLTVGDRVYAGVAHAGLFTSDDDGETWSPNPGLNEHATREEWEPGFGGLCAHRILVDGDRMWVGISAVGVFRSDDGGTTWDVKNDGVPPAGIPEDSPRPEVGYCVHGLAQDPSNLDTIWRQDHMGMHRTTDGGDNWERINHGLPEDFGFVIWRDHGSGRLFTIPLDADINRLPPRGDLAAYMSDDGGDSWRVAGDGWGSAPNFTGVLRGAFDGDGEGTFAFGTTSGNVWLTTDNGDSWECLDPVFPRIGALSIF